MSKALIIAKKEIRGYLLSPAAYIVIVVFLILAGWFFANSLFLEGKADLSGLFKLIPIAYLFFIPSITMGAIAREKHAGTLEILTTLPVTEKDIVLGKYLSSLALVGLALACTVIHLLTIYIFGEGVDVGALIGGYLAMILLGASYCAIGIFGSTLHENQIVSFIISFLIVFVLFIIDYILALIPASIAGILQYIGSGYHLVNLTRGVIDTRDLLYFGSIIFLFLRLTIYMLERRKWR